MSQSPPSSLHAGSSFDGSTNPDFLSQPAVQPPETSVRAQPLPQQRYIDPATPGSSRTPLNIILPAGSFLPSKNSSPQSSSNGPFSATPSSFVLSGSLHRTGNPINPLDFISSPHQPSSHGTFVGEGSSPLVATRTLQQQQQQPTGSSRANGAFGTMQGAEQSSENTLRQSFSSLPRPSMRQDGSTLVTPSAFPADSTPSARESFFLAQSAKIDAATGRAVVYGGASSESFVGDRGSGNHRYADLLAQDIPPTEDISPNNENLGFQLNTAGETVSLRPSVHGGGYDNLSSQLSNDSNPRGHFSFHESHYPAEPLPPHDTSSNSATANPENIRFFIDPQTSKQDGQSYWSVASWEQRRRYLSYYLPIATWLPKYQWGTQLLPDISAGLSVGAMLTPQSMAYSSILHLPPIYGMITALVSGIVYFILGHSPILTVGPEATTSILLGDTLASLPAVVAARARGEDPTLIIQQAASAISLLAGIITLAFGLFRLGFVDGVFSRPVLAGFVLAVGLQLLLDQTPKVLGIAACESCESSVSKISYLWDRICIQWDVNYCAMIIGIGCVAYLAYYASLRKKYPKSTLLLRTPHIFALVFVVTYISYLFDLETNYNISVIGKKNSSIPPFSVPVFSSDNLSTYLSSAIILSVLGFIETQLINKTVNLPQSTVSPNRELVAFGTSHIVCSFYGGYIGYGSITRTRVSLSAGSTSQMANAIAIIMCLLSILFLMPFFAYLPTAATGGIIFFVALGLIDFHQTSFAFYTRQWFDLGLNISMMFVTFFFGVNIGLFFAFAFCLLFVIKQQNKPSVRLLGRLRPHHHHPHQQQEPHQQPQQHQQDQHIHHSQHDVVAHAGDDDTDSQSPAGAQLLLASGGVLSTDPATATTTSAAAAAAAAAAAEDDYFEFDDNAQLHACELEGVLIYQIDGPLFFCNAENLKDRMRRVELYGCVMSHPSEPPHPLNLRAIIFDLQSVTTMDATAAQIILELVSDYHERNIRVIFVKLRKSLLPLLVDAGVTKIVGMHSFKRNIDAAVEYVERLEQAEKDLALSAPTL